MKTIDKWEEFRRQMPVAQKWAYFDHAAVAPLPDPARQALTAWAADAANDGAVNWKSWRQRVEEVRRLGASLIGAPPDDVALVSNTTAGVNLVAEGYPWQSGDNVVVPAGEFPTNLYPWLNLADRGVETRIVPTENEQLDLARLCDACDGRTRIVAVSWVGYATGWRNDVDQLAEVAHRNGALLFLDAIQALGVFPLDVSQTPIDFLAADGHKWLLGPEGLGLFYCRPEHLDLLHPLGVGWNSAANAGNYADPDLKLKKSASRYEGGSYNMASVAALEASLRLLTGCGTQALAERLLDVTDRLCDRLHEVGAIIVSCREGDRRSGIVAFELSGQDSAEVRRRCWQAGVILSLRAGRLRVSPHVYTNDDDIDRLVVALSD